MTTEPIAWAVKSYDLTTVIHKVGDRFEVGDIAGLEHPRRCDHFHLAHAEADRINRLKARIEELDAERRQILADFSTRQPA